MNIGPKLAGIIPLLSGTALAGRRLRDCQGIRVYTPQARATRRFTESWTVRPIFPRDFPFGMTFHTCYIPPVEWEVEFTGEFERWWSSLSEDEQEDINAKVILLQRYGPALRRPHSDVVASSRHPRMKEPRI
jgi:hypothetical protein